MNRSGEPDPDFFEKLWRATYRRAMRPVEGVLIPEEAARTLAMDGATVLACLSAWPASVTDRASRLPQDRQSRLFDLYDCARAAENQVVWVSSNQTGVMGGLRFLGQAKVVGPGGDVLARTSSKGGLAVAELDPEVEVARARRVLHHLAERTPEAYVALRAAAADVPGA